MITSEETILSEQELNNVSGGAGGKVRPMVSKAKCIKCGQCRAHCPMSAIEVKPSGVQVKNSLCNGCGDCASVCPAAAITMVG